MIIIYNMFTNECDDCSCSFDIFTVALILFHKLNPISYNNVWYMLIYITAFYIEKIVY